MFKKKLIFNIVQLFLVISFILWLGTYVARHLVVFQLFDAETMELKSLFNNIDLAPFFYSFYPLILSNIILYLLFILLFITFLFLSDLKLKNNGWLLIITIIIFATLPFEIFLLLKDYLIAQKILELNNKESLELIKLIKERLIILSNFSIIEIFSYFFIIYLVIFKPLQKSI